MNSFCSRCGVPLLPAARFCTACGQAVQYLPGRTHRRVSLERFAPLVVLGGVLAVTGGAVVIGTQTAHPPNVPPPRAAGGGPGMPENHPPIEVPEDVRRVIARMVETAKSTPEDTQAWLQLGFVQYRAGQVEPAYLADAAASYAHVLEREPENLDALRGLGNIAYDRNQPEQALEYFRRYLRIKPDDLGVQTDLATMLLATQQTAAAIKAYEDVVAIDPKHFQARFNLAIAYRAAGQNEKALAALQQARDVAGDESTRQHVEALIARLQAPAAAAEDDTGAPADFRADVEAVFRSHPIIGSRLDRIDWPNDDSARVVVREFPMDGMPQPARQRFVERIRTGLRASKTRHQRMAALTIELIDSGSGRVMETVTE